MKRLFVDKRNIQTNLALGEGQPLMPTIIVVDEEENLTRHHRVDILGPSSLVYSPYPVVVNKTPMAHSYVETKADLKCY